MKVYWLGFAFLVAGSIVVQSPAGRWRFPAAWSICLASQMFGLGMMIGSVLVGWYHWPAS